MIPTDDCSICGGEYEEEEGGIQGYFGIVPVTFCVWCYSSLHDMFYQEAEEAFNDNKTDQPE